MRCEAPGEQNLVAIVMLISLREGRVFLPSDETDRFIELSIRGEAEI